uniref:SAM_MT_RSMB_NOP domain-containing protein n=1 Tax=Steinernema glaseri TaxID=37863 RepID=A0A1I7ZLW8_9BILA
MEQFFESAGFLYFVSCRARDLKQHTIDTILEKFSPIDNGHFCITKSLDMTQVSRLFEKCAPSEKKVVVEVSTSFSMEGIALTDLIDFGKYYPTKAVCEERKYLRYLDASKLEFRVQNSNDRRLTWQWSDGTVPWMV